MNHHRLIAGITAAVVLLLAGGLIFHKQIGIPLGPSTGTVEGPAIEGQVQTGTGQLPEAIAPEFAFRRLEIDTSKPQAEACRELAHEYGHAVLPAIGGFKSPEDWANGYLGERLFLRWLR